MKRDEIKSLFTFSPHAVQRNRALVEGLTICMEWAAELSETVGLPVSVKMQRSPKTDELALLVECGRKNFSFHTHQPLPVFRQVSKQLFTQIERFHEQQETKEPAPRAQSSKRHRRKNSARVRSS